MKNFKQKRQVISFFMVFMFLLTFIPKSFVKVKAEETGAVAADTMAVLVGDFVEKQELGKNWEPKNYQTMMKEFSNGIYELTVDFKSAGDYKYKAALNGTWDKCYGAHDGEATDNDHNRNISVTAAGKVTFKLDLKKGIIYDSINDKDKFKLTAGLVGNLVKTGGEDWNPANTKFNLDYIGESFYKKTFTLKAGSYEYKIAYNGAWNNGEVGTNGTFKLDNDQDVTFVGNPDLGICMDSINHPEINTPASIIGTIRNDDNNNWKETLKGYEFSTLSNDGNLIYTKFLPAGDYEYKVCLNYSWNVSIPKDNTKITIPEGGKYVVFVCDTKAKTIIDSINNGDKVAQALGLSTPPVEVKSPIINADGTVTFMYKDPNAKAVYLAGDMTNWDSGKKLMSKNVDGIWSIQLRLGDSAQKLGYKYIVDDKWITDPSNALKQDNNSLLDLPVYTGRKVVLAGTIQSVVGEGNWTPGSDKTKLNYDGNGLYSITISNVPAGSYEYKIAMGSWGENYGAAAKRDGANLSLAISKTQDVKFIYSDDSHNVVDSVNYKVVDATLQGTGIDNIKLKDENLSGVYSAKVSLKAGTYSDLHVVIGEEKILVGKLTLSEDKTITISYDPITKLVFNDASSLKIDTTKLLFNSRDLQYKNPYGATPLGTPITFNLQSGKDDITSAKVIFLTAEGLKFVDMAKSNEKFAYDKDGAYDKWTAQYTFDKIGMNKYYFVISNGSDVKAYGVGADGNFGVGQVGNLGQVGQYDLNIYAKDFKTPDWMKNAVVYQIFPDRFFNGDRSNDKLQKLARGTTPYEFYEDWYGIPEDPQIETKSDYTGTKGDGIWSNEMYGGDLKGIQQKLDYLQGIGVNVLYLNPISQSISNHRYDTTDYHSVDPLLGNADEFVNLTKEAHNRGMHLILDGVFNHVSDDSVYFDRYNKYMGKGKPVGAYQYWSRVYDLINTKNLTQQEAEAQVTGDLASQDITDLHYKDWFKINNKKIAAVAGDAEHYDYEGWWGYDSMPVIQALNGSEYNVKTWDDEIIDGKDANSRYWLRQGSNGWRLDVANEVSDETWRHFREAVKSEGDNVIIGEIWTDASKYILGDMYDSVMNYRFRDAVLNFVKGTTDDNKTAVSAVKSMNDLENMREQYPKEAFEAMLNLVDSHDTQRVISALDGYQKSQKAVAQPFTAAAKAKMKMIPLIQMTYPGAPCIYYGDETGLTGADDPDNRRTMIWGKGDKELTDWYAELGNIRNNYEVLRTGDISTLQVQSSIQDDVMAYTRSNKDSNAVIVINRKTEDLKDVKLDVKGIAEGTKLTNALNPTEEYTVTGGSITINVPKQLGVILVTNYKTVSVNEDKIKDSYDPKYTVPLKKDLVLTNVTEKQSFDLGSDAKVSVNAINNTTINKDITLIEALFDNNNKFVTYVAVSQNVKAGDSVKMTGLLKIPNSGNYKIKCFIWDSLENMNALSDVIEIPVK